MKYKDDMEVYAEEVRKILGDINKLELEYVAVKIAEVLDKIYYKSSKTKTSKSMSYGETYLKYLNTVLGMTRNTPSYDTHFYLVSGIKGVGEIAKKVYNDHRLDMLYKKITQ